MDFTLHDKKQTLSISETILNFIKTILHKSLLTLVPYRMNVETSVWWTVWCGMFILYISIYFGNIQQPILK